MGVIYSSVVEYLPSIYKILHSAPSTTHTHTSFMQRRPLKSHPFPRNTGAGNRIQEMSPKVGSLLQPDCSITLEGAAGHMLLAQRLIGGQKTEIALFSALPPPHLPFQVGLFCSWSFKCEECVSDQRIIPGRCVV